MRLRNLLNFPFECGCRNESCEKALSLAQKFISTCCEVEEILRVKFQELGWNVEVDENLIFWMFREKEIKGFVKILPSESEKIHAWFNNKIFVTLGFAKWRATLKFFWDEKFLSIEKSNENERSLLGITFRFPHEIRNAVELAGRVSVEWYTKKKLPFPSCRAGLLWPYPWGWSNGSS